MKWTDDKLERRNMKYEGHLHTLNVKNMKNFFDVFPFSLLALLLQHKTNDKVKTEKLSVITYWNERSSERRRAKKSMSEWENSIFWTAVIKCYYRQPISVLYAFELSSLNCSGNFVERNVLKFISRLRTKLN